MGIVQVTNRNYQAFLRLPLCVLTLTTMPEEHLRTPTLQILLSLTQTYPAIAFGLSIQGRSHGYFMERFHAVNRLPLSILLQEGKEQSRIYRPSREQLEENIRKHLLNIPPLYTNEF